MIGDDEGVIERFRASQTRKVMRFFASIHGASPGWSFTWWLLLIIRGILPTALSVCFGWLVSAVSRDVSATAPLIAVGITFILLVVLLPVHTMVSSNLGDRVASHLYDRLTFAGVSPEGIGHLELPELANDLTMARDFDQGIMGPPLSISMDFLTGGLLDLVIGAVAAVVLFGFAWWAPPVVVAGWVATHWLLRESGVWRDRNTDEVRTAQRHADYSYRLAVDALPSKELRFFGLAGWVTERFISTRTKLYDLQYEATKLREKSLAGAIAIVAVANGLVFWAIGVAANNGDLSTARAVVFVQAAIGVSSIAFGGLNWALDGASAPVEALARLEPAMAKAGALSTTVESSTGSVASDVAPEIAFRGVRFAYGSEGERNVLENLDLTIPAGKSLAIVGQNGAGKTTIAKLICRLYDPNEGRVEIGGSPLTTLATDQWRRRVTAVFQDYVRFELSLRTNVAPLGAPDEVIRIALADAGAEGIADGNLNTVLSKGYSGGTDLSGGQWQRVAIARALCAVRMGADVVLLDEPTAQLDVRGETEIFERVLRATKGCTTILISHRFSTVRLADRICVVEGGRVIEQGTHDELIALGGRYRTMFELQASRFADGLAAPEIDAHGQEVVHDTL